MAYNGLGVVLPISRKSRDDFPKCTVCRPSELSSLVPHAAQCGGWRFGLETRSPTALGG